MDGSAKYELLHRIAGERIVAFRGRQTQGAQIVLLHQLTGTNDHTDVLRMALEYLLLHPASAGGRIVDLVEIQGLYYVVTLDQPECLALREWLKWELEGAKPAPVYVPPAPPPQVYVPPVSPSPVQAPAREPGEFTRLFQEQQAGRTPPPEQQRTASSPAPGEFTELFGRGGRSQPGQQPPLATPVPMTASPLPVEKQQPGEFTRLFRSPLATPAESPMSSLPASSPPSHVQGEFTRIFGGGTPSAASPPPAPAPPAAAPVPASAPGFLTESLEPRSASTSRPDSPPVGAAPSPGEFTRVIRGPASGGAVPSSPPPPASPAGAAPAFPAAPSMPAAPAAPTLPPPPAAPTLPPPPAAPAFQAPAAPAAPAAQAATGRPGIALIILFVVLLIAALALIGFVVLRH